MRVRCGILNRSVLRGFSAGFAKHPGREIQKGEGSAPDRVQDWADIVTRAGANFKHAVIWLEPQIGDAASPAKQK